MSVDSSVQYDHSLNLHSSMGALAAVKRFKIFENVRSVLDVGAGTGTWLSALKEIGINDLVGIDGVPTDGRTLAIDPSYIKFHDLTRPLELDRSFDLVICLEVAEHLDADAAETLIASLCRHADQILFSAAAPGQAGQNHVNCQWPEYWQSLFNQNGFACFDEVRSDAWSDQNIEPWYRQNIFVARRDATSGLEKRIPALIHPEMVPHMHFSHNPAAIRLNWIENGSAGGRFYLSLAINYVRRHLGILDRKDQVRA